MSEEDVRSEIAQLRKELAADKAQREKEQLRDGCAGMFITLIFLVLAGHWLVNGGMTQLLGIGISAIFGK